MALGAQLLALQRGAVKRREIDLDPLIYVEGVIGIVVLVGLLIATVVGAVPH